MFTTAGFRVLARSTQLGAGTVGLGLTATVRSLHSGVVVLVNPRCGARPTMAATAATTTAAAAARYRVVNRFITRSPCSELARGVARGSGDRSGSWPSLRGLQLLMGDGAEGAAPSQVHRDPVLLLHAFHVPRPPQGVGEQEPDVGR